MFKFRKEEIAAFAITMVLILLLSIGVIYVL